jgi:membrane-bound lytic murein transglycosylase D
MESFRRIFREEGLPEELTYLPHVESSFDVHAFSKAGAAGIWQFTRSTGRRFLRIDEVVDERRDPLRSARAAAMLLKENYEKLGSWPLAVTAYNHGAEGMVRAKRRHGDFPTILRRYRSRSFGFASRNFYAEFLAALSVARDAATHFPGIWPTSPRPSRICVIEGFADLRDLADHFGFGTDHLLALNPSLQPAVAAGEKRVPRHFSLRVPETQGAMWAGRPPASLLRPEQLPSRRHRIRKGETLSGIARRYRVDLQALLVANGLHMRSTIFPGQVLRLPGGPKARTARVETPEPSGGTDSGIVTPLRRIPVADG